jgi:hypothetical protein
LHRLRCVAIGLFLILPCPLVGKQREHARHARDHRHHGDARHQLAEFARRALLLIQSQLLGLGQLASLINSRCRAASLTLARV